MRAPIPTPTLSSSFPPPFGGKGKGGGYVTRCRVPVLALAAAFGLAMTAAAAPLHPPAAAPAPSVVLADAQYGDAADDADFLFRLGMLEGHLMVGHELLAAHQGALALPHFGHPVRELYDDIADYLAAKKFPAFDAQLADLEARVAADPYGAETEAKYQAAVATVHRARELAPPDVRASVPEMIKLCANVMDAASGEFGESLERGRIAVIVEYHDSRGYLEYVEQQLHDLRAAHPDQRGLFDRFGAVLAKAQWIVGDLLPGPAPRASVGTYRDIAAQAADLAKPQGVAK